jgi:hypothetical protein
MTRKLSVQSVADERAHSTEDVCDHGQNHANYDRDPGIKRSNGVNRLDHVRLLAVAIDVSVIRENSRCAIKPANQHGLIR